MFKSEKIAFVVVWSEDPGGGERDRGKKIPGKKMMGEKDDGGKRYREEDIGENILGKENIWNVLSGSGLPAR